jgi:hypothetical protein
VERRSKKRDGMVAERVVGRVDRSGSCALGAVITAGAVDEEAKGAHGASEGKVASKLSTAALHSPCWGAQEMEVSQGGVAIAVSFELRGWEAEGMVAVIDRFVGRWTAGSGCEDEGEGEVSGREGSRSGRGHEYEEGGEDRDDDGGVGEALDTSGSRVLVVAESAVGGGDAEALNKG